MALITRSNWPSLLRPGLAAVFADYNIYPDQWKEIYAIHRSDKAVEYELEMKPLGIAQYKADGAPVAQDTMDQRYTSVYQMQYYGISFQITRGAIMDNLYQKDFPQQSIGLRNSLQTLKNINGAYLFNNATGTGSTLSDGQPMLSTAHPIDTGVIANTFTNGVQFNEASVEDMITLMRSCQNVAGQPLNLSPVKTVVPQARAFDASRLYKSTFRTGTANNDISAIYHDKYMPGGYVINNFITNPNYWFILSDSDEGFKFYLRESLDIDFITDPVTDNVTVRAIERYAFGNSNWRSVYGSVGA
jgi:hypothetical protein